MSEVSNSNFLSGTVFEPISDKIVEIDRQTDMAQQAFESLTQARDEAMAAAAQPFAEGIDQASQELSQLSRFGDANHVADMVRELDISPLSRTALHLILQKNGIKLTDFAEDLRALSKASQEDAAGLIRFTSSLNTFLAFDQFQNTVEAANPTEVPVGLVHLEWFEYYDSQAEFEGRKSGTGEYAKKCQFYLGKISLDDIQVEVVDISTDGGLVPTLTPSAIRVIIGTGQFIDTDIDWGDLSSTVKDFESVTIPLIDTVEDRRPASPLPWRMGSIDWRRSLDNDFSLTNFNSYHGRNVSMDATSYLVWGENVHQTLVILEEDEKVPSSTKVALRKLSETL